MSAPDLFTGGRKAADSMTTHTEETMTSDKEGQIVVQDGSMSPLMHLAIEKGASVEALERLFNLHERDVARKAAMAFNEAMSRFKATCPPVRRRTENAQFYVTRNGVKAPVRYANLEDIEATIRAPAGECGLSFRWGDARVDDGKLTLSCIVSHSAGHHEVSSVTLPLDSRAGCSEAQKYGAVMTYAQRYSLIHAFGLTTCDEDVDGAAPHQNGAKVTPHEIEVMEDLLTHCPSGTRERLLAYVGVATMEEIPQARFASLLADLEKKVKASR